MEYKNILLQIKCAYFELIKFGYISSSMNGPHQIKIPFHFKYCYNRLGRIGHLTPINMK